VRRPPVVATIKRFRCDDSDVARVDDSDDATLIDDERELSLQLRAAGTLPPGSRSNAADDFDTERDADADAAVGSSDDVDTDNPMRGVRRGTTSEENIRPRCDTDVDRDTRGGNNDDDDEDDDNDDLAGNADDFAASALAVDDNNDDDDDCSMHCERRGSCCACARTYALNDAWLQNVARRLPACKLPRFVFSFTFIAATMPGFAFSFTFVAPGGALTSLPPTVRLGAARRCCRDGALGEGTAAAATVDDDDDAAAGDEEGGDGENDEEGGGP
jgi:hypothetical protein